MGFWGRRVGWGRIAGILGRQRGLWGGLSSGETFGGPRGGSEATGRVFGEDLAVLGGRGAAGGFWGRSDGFGALGTLSLPASNSLFAPPPSSSLPLPLVPCV